MAIGWQQILIILVLALLLFGGGGKISAMMGDFAKGIKAFRKGLKDEDKQIDDQAGAPVDITPAKDAESKNTPKSTE